MSPKVSIIIATYNWSAALRCALRSVRMQAFGDFEVLVIGDGCTDDSAAVVASFEDPRFIWCNLAGNSGGQSTPNNHGLSIARGEWVAYHGHDDIWHPEHLAAGLRTGEQQKADLVGGVCILYGPEGSGIRGLSGLPESGVFGARDFFPPSSMMHRRDMIRKSGLWPMPGDVQVPVDCAFVRAARLAGAHIVPTRTLSVFKFPAAWRRDSYRLRTVGEQEAMLARLAAGPDIRTDELMAVMQSVASNAFVPIALPDDREDGNRHEFNRKVRGLVDQVAAGSLRGITRPETFRVAGESAVFEWHDEENHAVHGTYRWTGPLTSSSISLPVRADEPLRITLHVIAALDADCLDRLQIDVNGSAAPSRRDTLPDGTFAFVIDHRPAENAPAAGLRLTVRTPHTQRPVDRDINSDTRWLGVAIGQILVEPPPGQR